MAISLRERKLLGFLFVLMAFCTFVSDAFTQFELGRAMMPLLACYGILMMLLPKGEQKEGLFMSGAFTVFVLYVEHQTAAPGYVVCALTLLTVGILSYATKDITYEWVPREHP